MGRLVVTIGRQSGSGGRKIGELLAKKLGISFYDRELLTRAAKESGYCEELFQMHDEKPNNSFLYSLVMDTYSLGYGSSAYMDMPINHKIFLAQFEAIKKIANQENCVIVGRCADYALSELKYITSVFICADDTDRIQRMMEYYNIEFNKAKELMIKIDKKRAGYYNYYTNKRWGDTRSYDLCVNSSKLGIEGTVDLITSYVNIKKDKE